MTLSLRTRLLVGIVPLLVAVAVLAVAGVSPTVVAVVALVAAGVAAGLLVLFTQPFEALKSDSARQLTAGRGNPATASQGDGTDVVRQLISTLTQQLQQNQKELNERNRQFQTSLTDTTTALNELASGSRKATEFQTSQTPWPELSSGLSKAVNTVAAALGQSNRRSAAYHGVLNDIPDPVVVGDSQNQLLFINPAASKLLNITPASAVKKSLTSLFRDPGLNLWDDTTSQVLSVEKFKSWLSRNAGGTCDAIAVTGDDDGTRVAVTVLPLSARMTKPATVLLLKDLTTQRKQDSDIRLQHRTTVAQRLCLLVENEARPALEAIRTSATLLSQTAKQIGQRERFVPKVERMLDELSRQEVVITLLGWLGRLTKSFGSSQDLNEIRLRDQVDGVADKLTAVYGDRGNSVVVSGDAGWLIADEEWVTVLLTGVLLHANMTTKQEAVKVDLTRRSVVTADRELGEILVRYRGKQLPQEAVEDIREPFRRPNSLALESTSDLGFPLGLAVANRITGLMGGQLTVEGGDGECVVRVVVPTRATGSRIESQSGAASTAVAVSAVTATEATDVLGEWMVGGGKVEDLEPANTHTPLPVGAASLPLHDGEGTVGDWFSGPTG